MNFLTIFFISLGLLAAGLLSATLSLPLQAPALVFIGTAGFFAAMSSLLVAKSNRINGSPGSDRVWLPLLAIVSIAYFAARAHWSPVQDLGLEDLMLILPAGLFYLIAGHSVGDKAGVSLRLGIAWVVITLLMLHLASCFLQLYGDEGYSLALYFCGSSRSSDSHITGMYGYYGSFANFAVIAGLLCLSLGVWGKYKSTVKVFIFVLGLLALLLALLAQSRSAALSMGPAVVVYVVLMYTSLARQGGRVKIWTQRVLLLIGAGGCIAVVFGAFYVFGQRGSGLMSVFETGVRIPLWAMAAEQWSDNILLGAGGRSFSYECYSYWGDGLNSGEASPEFVHNEYLQVLADYGLVGFILFIGLLISHLALGLKQVHSLSGRLGEGGLRQGSNALALAIAGTAGMVAMVIHICFDFPTRILPNLLLMICCAVWVLPLPFLNHQKSEHGRTAGIKNQLSQLGIIVLMILSLATIGLGAYQCYSGAPLVKNKMAREHGAWNAENADREAWIPALEKSLERAPYWRRYERLGALYQVSATHASLLRDRQNFVDRAEASYLAALERNPFDLIAKLNLASLYTEHKYWDKADEVYAGITEFARARERRFRVHKKWGDMHLMWAEDLMAKQLSNEVEMHLAEAKRLYKSSYDYAHYYDYDEWVLEYTRLLIGYAAFLGHQNRYDEAQGMFQEAKQQSTWVRLQAQTRVNVYFAKQLYGHGMYLWNQRKPEEAYGLMLEAKEALEQHRKFMKGGVGQMWHEVADQVEEMIQFFRDTGIKSKARTGKR